MSSETTIACATAGDDMRGVGVGCRGADAPLPRGRRLHGHRARREPARGLHRRSRHRGRDDAGARARGRVLGDDLRAAGRGGRHRSRADLQPGPRDAVRRASGARDGVGAGAAAPARRRRARDGIRDRARRDRSGRVGRARVRSDAAAGPDDRAAWPTSGPCSPCSASSARSFPSSCTTTARRTSW